MHGNLALDDRREAEAPSATDGQFVAFSCGDAHYGIPIMAVREIRSWQPTTIIPGRSSAGRGVLDIRGTVVEVFDLAELLGGAPIVATSGSVVLVLALANRVVAILVDAVSDIIHAGPADLMPVPADHLPGTRNEQVTGLVRDQDRVIGILHLDKVFD